MHYDLIGVYAKSQLDYPNGVGVKHSLFVKSWVLGKKELTDCTRAELNNLILGLRKEYEFLKSKDGST